MRRRLPPEERRALIEQAAGQLFATRGYDGATLDEIARAAGVTKPMLYRHFDSKKALYLALLERHREDLPTFVPPGAGPLTERLPEVLDRWFAYVEQRSFAWKMLFRDTTGDAEIQVVRLAVQARAREVMVAILAGEPSLPREALEPAAELLRTGMAGLALWWLDHPDTPRAVLVDVVSRALRGLLAP